tara:strand:+ start:2233 stop:2730 length:498 start_codon:yes stop_codon:yes gene_type:complete
MPNIRNTTKNTAIINMRIEHPEFTLGEIGERFNLTRERIRQILVYSNMETRSSKRIELANTPRPTCAIIDCENLVADRVRTYCTSCVKTGRWLKDMGVRRQRIPRITIQCKRCNKDIIMRETLYKRQRNRYINIFCSQFCRSKYVWETQQVRNVNGKIQKIPLGK